MKRIIDLFKETFGEWSEDDCLQLGASLAYYALFSLFPLLLIIVTLIGFFLGDKQAQVVETVTRATSPQIGSLVGQTLQGMREKQSAGGISAIIGFVTLLLGASGVFGQLDTAFNQIWNVKKPEVKGGIKEKIMAAVKEKSLSFLLVMGTVFLLFASMVISSVITALGSTTQGLLPGGAFVWQLVQTVVSIGLIAVAFAALFKLLPDTKVEWRDVWWGALLTSVLFSVLKQLLSWYIGNSGSFAAYGLVGAVLALLTWIYFTGQILFFGGEFTQVYARHYGSRTNQVAQPSKVEVDPATALALAAAVAKPSTSPAGIKRQEELSKQRYAFAAGGVVAGVVGTLIAAIVGTVVGVVRGVLGLRKRA